ncbi:MAG: type I-C CRISPR-associated protein Cas5c [Thermoguttaceae bacterium]
MPSTIGRYEVRIRGQLACFTRPEFKTERLSYEVLTPSAARGVLEAILWKPAICWHIRRIRLLSPVQFVQFRRNEVNSRVATPKAAAASRTGAGIDDYFADEDRAQRNTVALQDVDYAVDAEMVMTSRAGSDDNPRKFDEMFRRRLERGQFHSQPYLGCREFPAIVEPYRGDPPPQEEESRDLGLMLHDIRYSAAGNQAVFFNARLNKGVIEVPEWRVA